LFNPKGALTEASARPVNAIALDHTREAAAATLQLAPEDFAGVHLFKQYTSEHSGVRHFVYRQTFSGLRVWNAEWVVNVDSAGRVLNAGGNLFPRPQTGLAIPSPESMRPAFDAAAQDVTSLPGLSEGGQPVWFGWEGRLRPAWVFHVSSDNGIDAFETVVDAQSRKILERRALTKRQRPRARGLVFERDSPQPNPRPGTIQVFPPPFVQRTLQSLDGDPAFSPAGWVSGTSTIGNNTVTGANPLGVLLLASPAAAISANRDFSFPLDHGLGSSSLLGYQDASSTNLFYWINRAHDLFYEIGFTEAAGNFQTDNFGKGGVGGDAIFAYSFFASAPGGPAFLSNAFFTARGFDDGAQSMLAFYLSFGPDRGFTDNSFDAITVIHEYAHGVSSRLVRRLGTHHGDSMGEAWSDFYSLEFTLPEGAPVDGVYPYSEYPEQSWGAGIRTRPYSTDMNVNPLTFGEMGRVIQYPEVHADGEIWMQALWEVRANLIRQFGEREGRRRVRLLVLDGMKLAPPAPSMIDMRDAILLADRAAFNGASQQQIWTGFAKRGFGVLAQTFGPDTVHIVPSSEEPSNTAQIRFYEPQFVHGEFIRMILHDANLSGQSVQAKLASTSGDVESMTLLREGLVYTGLIPSSANVVTRENGTLNLAVGDSITAFYLDRASADGAPRLIETTATSMPIYGLALSAPRFQPGQETDMNFRAPFNPSLAGGTPSVRLVVLPWEFPFFGKKHRTVWVHNNGLLAFDLPVLTRCTDASSLAAYNAVAPMWLEMNTLGLAQRTEGVFIGRPFPDQITFRWAGGLDVGPGFTPEPVNFMATLFQDGRIVFNYGTGNKNLSLGTANSSCVNVSTPTVGLSNGHDVFPLIVPTHSGLSNLENAPTITLDPPFGYGTLPQGRVVSPANGGALPDLFTITGVASDEFHPVSRIDTYIDGVYRLRGAAAPRPPACDQIQAAVCIGFTVSGSARALGLDPGKHKVWFRVMNTRGGFTDFPSEPLVINIAAPPSQPASGQIEAPSAGQQVSGTFRITGWAYVPDLRVIAADVLIDGASYVRATYGAPRAEVCTSLGPRPAACPGIGFTAQINSVNGPVPLVNGEHSMQIRLQDQTGRYHLISESPVNFTVDNPVNLPPVGDILAPQNNSTVSGIITVSGYAYDPDGRVASVLLIVDNVSRGAATLGGDRSAVCANLTDVAACPNIGFEINFDTRTLANGLHSLRLRAVDASGAASFIPAAPRAGLNIFVRN
jgi:hypothetical protein